jgi:hypothetical protein
MNKKQDLLNIIEVIQADLAESVWIATEYPSYDLHKLYEFPDKRLKELGERIEELWGE